MRRLQCLIAASVLIALSGAVAGCSSGISSWDSMDSTSILDTEKKLPGERKPVFPMRAGPGTGRSRVALQGASQQEIDQQNAEAAAAAARHPPRTQSRNDQPNPGASNPTRPAPIRGRNA